MLESYAAHQLPVPYTVWRGYDLPGFVGPDTLVIGISYSGNTEETLSAFRAARERGAKLLAISTGGELARLAQEWDIPLLTFQYPAQPRATLGYLFTPLLALFHQLGFLPDQSHDIREALDVARRAGAEWGADRPSSQNLAKQMAQEMHGSAAVIYGADYLAAVARRWKTQMNENAKEWAFYEEFSELNHNAIVGYEYPAGFTDAVRVVVLRGRHLPERIQLRMEVTQKLMDDYRVPWRVVDAQGERRLAEMVSLIALGDFVTYYLALLNGADPTTIDPINYLKDALSRA